MARASKDVWAKRVERWRASDLTAVEFASEIGVNVNTLRSWSWKLGANQDGRARGRPRATSSAATTPSFVELTPALLGASSLEVVVAERFVVRVPPSFDVTSLHELVRALESMA